MATPNKGKAVSVRTFVSLFVILFLFVMSHRESIDVNDALMELLIMCYACKTSCARKITGKNEMYSVL